MAELLELLKSYLEANKKSRDCASKALVMIRDNWKCKVADMIEYKGYFKQTLKSIAQVSWRSDVPSLAIAF